MDVDKLIKDYLKYQQIIDKPDFKKLSLVDRYSILSIANDKAKLIIKKIHK